MKQLALTFPEKKQRGGARVGAGRKRLRGALSHTPHRARELHRAAHPVHVTLRASLRSLRSQRVARVVLGAMRDSNSERFRVTHYSVQDNHVHLLVEAEGKAELSRGMRGLAVRVAKRVNRLLSRRGRFWADRWHGHALRSPREVRNALVYVLQNRAKHAPSKQRAPALDPLSSAEHFDGFADRVPNAFRSIGPPCVAFAQTWLLRVGWKRHGLIRSSEVPKG